ncbi:hypothetical protein GCM10009765_68590 [Fodinicola feengrottensis]|uniref:Uncharacterized protein n=1 Tax=Fodinicola feengrottensis TaxID=435914 RepID=A0ABP4USU3_9ACTN
MSTVGKDERWGYSASTEKQPGRDQRQCFSSRPAVERAAIAWLSWVNAPQRFARNTNFRWNFGGETGTLLSEILSPLAKPRPAEDGRRDERSVSQRNSGARPVSRTPTTALPSPPKAPAGSLAPWRA